MRKTEKRTSSVAEPRLPLVQLQSSCSRALDRYIKVADKTRAFMSRAEESPLVPEYREMLLAHLRTETRAHDAYMRARRQLWTVLAGNVERQAEVFTLAA